MISHIITSENTSQVEALVGRYKAHIKETRLEDELYKWKLLKQFSGKPDLEATDFGQEIKNINYFNLMFQTARAVVRDMAERAGEEYRQAFRIFFNESIPLSERLNKFEQDAEIIYERIRKEERFTAYHDERTMATLLTYRYPENYTFYKDAFYRKFCDLLGIKSKKKGEKYLHYLELVDDLVENYLKKDAELLAMVDGLLTEDCFLDTNRKILAQDILYQMLDKDKGDDTENPEVLSTEVAVEIPFWSFDDFHELDSSLLEAVESALNGGYSIDFIRQTN